LGGHNYLSPSRAWRCQGEVSIPSYPEPELAQLLKFDTAKLAQLSGTRKIVFANPELGTVTASSR
jgi:hypothetical protein